MKTIYKIIWKTLVCAGLATALIGVVAIIYTVGVSIFNQLF